MHRDYLATDDETVGRGPCPDCAEVKPAFDLAKAVANGCLAGDRPARVVCTDFKSQEDRPLVIAIDHGSYETIWAAKVDGHIKSGSDMDLRNLPEYQEVEVTLWIGQNGETAVWNGEDGPETSYWKPYGPPVTVRFPKSC